jgi:hypothetical protein
LCRSGEGRWGIQQGRRRRGDGAGPGAGGFGRAGFARPRVRVVGMGRMGAGWGDGRIGAVCLIACLRVAVCYCSDCLRPCLFDCLLIVLCLPACLGHYACLTLQDCLPFCLPPCLSVITMATACLPVLVWLPASTVSVDDPSQLNIPPSATSLHPIPSLKLLPPPSRSSRGGFGGGGGGRTGGGALQHFALANHPLGRPFRIGTDD